MQQANVQLLQTAGTAPTSKELFLSSVKQSSSVMRLSTASVRKGSQPTFVLEQEPTSPLPHRKDRPRISARSKASSNVWRKIESHTFAPALRA